MKNKGFSRKYMLPLFSLMVFALRCIQANFCYPRGEDIYENVCQLYFGGITVDNSFDITSVSVYGSLMLFIVVVANGQYLFEMMSNDYMLLCRTGSRTRLFDLVARRALKQNVIMVLINYAMYLGVERTHPDVGDAFVLCTEIVLTFSLFIICLVLVKISGYKESYIITFCIFLLFTTLTGSIFYVKERLPDCWGNLVLPQLIYNYSHSVVSSYTYDGTVYEEISYAVPSFFDVLHFAFVMGVGIIVYLTCRKIYSLKETRNGNHIKKYN